MRKFIAFTLAETLLVIGIIGVVAALTLPNLNSSTGDKEKVTKVKKIYENLNDALGRAEAVYGPYEEWFVNDADDKAKAKRAGERITEFMKVSKTCGLDTGKGCFTSGKSKGLPGGDYKEYDKEDSTYKIITVDNSSISFSFRSDNSSWVSVDIDGPNKGSYTLGKDLFLFSIDSKGGVLPAESEETFSALISSIKAKGTDAAAWIIKYDNMDYLKFDNSGKCPNGTTVTAQNPRCK